MFLRKMTRAGLPAHVVFHFVICEEFQPLPFIDRRAVGIVYTFAIQSLLIFSG